MGRTSKRLVIVVTEAEMLTWQGFVEYREKGHRVETLDEWARNRTLYGHDPNSGMGQEMPDVIFGPSAWYMDKQHSRYLEQAIKAARAKRYPTTGKSVKKDGQVQSQTASDPGEE